MSDVNPPAANLRTMNCLPVRTADGLDKVGFEHALLHAHNITALEVSLPPAAAGLWQILTVLAARATGLDNQDLDADDWFDLRENVLAAERFDSDAVTGYFDRFGDRFFLFHPERPWMQDPRLLEQCVNSSGLNRLVLGRPAGNNQPWMSHHHDRLPLPIPVDEALQHLVGQLYYGAPGRCTARTASGRTEANTTSGPLRGLVAHFPLGDNLFESLVASIPYPKQRKSLPDCAFWEETDLAHPLGMPAEVCGVGGLLAGRFRHAILLVPSADASAVTDAYLTWAWRQPQGPAEDPYLIYQTSKKGEIYSRPADLHRALWRDLDALLLEDVGLEHRRRPRVLELAEHLPWDLLDRLRIQAYGFDQDRSQVSDRQWFSSRTPHVFRLLRDSTATSAVSRMRQVAERAEQYMERALRTAWDDINGVSEDKGPTKNRREGSWPAQAAARYWPRAERTFWERVHSMLEPDPSDGIDAIDVTATDREFVAIAVSVYDDVTSSLGARPRAKAPIERHRREIFRALGTAKNHSEETVA